MENLHIWNPLDWGKIMITGASMKISELMNGFMDGFLKVGDTFINSIDEFSYEACLLVGLIALILSIFGYDKGKKIATISPAVYIILQIFLEVWFGV